MLVERQCREIQVANQVCMLLSGPSFPAVIFPFVFRDHLEQKIQRIQDPEKNINHLNKIIISNLKILTATLCVVGHGFI